MAHECPTCGLNCHCHGDIDDLVLNDTDSIEQCDHCSDYPYDDEPQEEREDADGN